MKNEFNKPAKTVKVELELDAKVAEQLTIMENYSKLSRFELVDTALKRFISQHKDYFPENYQG